MTPLEPYGWNDFFSHQTPEAPEGAVPARVTGQGRGHVRIVCASGELLAELAGRLRHLTREEDPDLPVVGDWVAVVPRPAEGRATIHALYRRRTALTRKASGLDVRAQVVAANVDRALLVMALNRDLNLRRLERYLAAVWESGAEPVVVLNKADLCSPEEVASVVEEVAELAPGVPVHPVSAVSLAGTEALRERFAEDRTCVLVGSSGVGKSTLTNLLLGRALQAVQEARAHDDRGRHTTTSRDAFLVPGGGVLIDTPGMRELSPWDAAEGVAAAFPEIEARAATCRFRDCTHDHEPGCAVVAALEAGDLDVERWDSFHKLKREMAFQTRKADLRARQAEHRRWKRISKGHKQRRKLEDW